MGRGGPRHPAAELRSTAVIVQRGKRKIAAYELQKDAMGDGQAQKEGVQGLPSACFSRSPATNRLSSQAVLLDSNVSLLGLRHTASRQKYILENPNGEPNGEKASNPVMSGMPVDLAAARRPEVSDSSFSWKLNGHPIGRDRRAVYRQAPTGSVQFSRGGGGSNGARMGSRRDSTRERGVFPSYPELNVVKLVRSPRPGAIDSCRERRYTVHNGQALYRV